MRSILRRLLAGELSEAEAEAELRRGRAEERGGGARLDLGRKDRRGLPEVVLASAKQPDEAARLVVALATEQGQGLISRMGPECRQEVERQASDAGCVVLPYHSAARVLRAGFAPERRPGRVALLAAGTAAVSGARAARGVGEACGAEAGRGVDRGVAGLHRLIGPLTETLAWQPDVFVVAAGMDGVLPGVVAGLVDLPVIGLPVGVGYGAGGGGEAALLTMLQSCSTGLVAVNVDNGVAAGAAAGLIAGRPSGRPSVAATARPRHAAS